MISITAIINIAQGRGEEAQTVFETIVAAVSEEPRTLVYTVSRGVDQPDLFTVFELYPDQEGLDEHRRGRGYTELQVPLRPLLEGTPTVKVAEVVASAK